MRSTRGSVLTIGAYDGVHLGHRRVIDEVRHLASDRQLESVVVTFDRHPASVVRPESAPLLLTDLQQRLELLKATGVDLVHVVEFTPERALESAEDFVEEVLVGELAARTVVVGRDFHFGHGRGGNVALLQKMGEEKGFSVEPFGLVSDGVAGEVISSTRIRSLVASGDLVAAGKLLGRPHEVRGLAVESFEGFSSAGEGGSGVEVEVPANILLPPPGGYLGEVGIVGAEGVGLSECRVLVSAGERGLSVVGAPESFPSSSFVRVLFREASVH